MGDEKLSLFFEGLENLEFMKSIIIRGNEMLDGVLKHIQNLMTRRFPYSLDELRLISTKTSPLIMSKLMENLAEECVIKKLSLIQC